jgi:peptidoglycan/LPS O-acetylase OafA/YrhL
MEKGVIKYRKDIDGLRALAVMSVVLYHLFPIIIQGGFMGVDIFFVISGYLISSIIFKNLEANNFSIYDFYAKRIKRIFPALILVIISCLVAGWFIMNSIEYVQLSKHAKASSYFSRILF